MGKYWKIPLFLFSFYPFSFPLQRLSVNGAENATSKAICLLDYNKSHSYIQFLLGSGSGSGSGQLSWHGSGSILIFGFKFSKNCKSGDTMRFLSDSQLGQVLQLARVGDSRQRLTWPDLSRSHSDMFGFFGCSQADYWPNCEHVPTANPNK